MSAGLLEFLTSGSVFGLVAGVLACEAVLLGVLWRWSGRGIAVADLLPALGAGLGLAVAALLALKGAPAMAVGTALCIALFAHSVDMFRRWRR